MSPHDLALALRDWSDTLLLRAAADFCEEAGEYDLARAWRALADGEAFLYYDDRESIHDSRKHDLVVPGPKSHFVIVGDEAETHGKRERTYWNKVSRHKGWYRHSFLKARYALKFLAEVTG